MATTKAVSVETLWNHLNQLYGYDSDVRSWDDWPAGEPVYGMRCLRQGGRYTYVSLRLLRAWQEATKTDLQGVDYDTGVTGVRRYWDLQEASN